MKGRAGLLISLMVAVCFHGTAAQAQVCETATVADIVFLVNGSASTKDFQDAQTFLLNTIKALEIGPNKVHVGVAQYGEEPHQEFLLKDHTDKKSLLAAVERIPHRGGAAHVGKALDVLLQNYFNKDAGSRASQRVPQIAVVLTDGQSKDEVEAPAQRLRQHGVSVFAFGVGEAEQKQLRSIASWPPTRFTATTDSYQTLTGMLDKVLNTVCVFVKDQTQALADRYADIFFLVDSDIPPGQSNIFKSELSKLVNLLNAGASTYRIGLAQYGDDVKVEFLLDALKSKQDIQAAVRRFRLRPQANRPRNLGSALRYARTHFFSSDVGGRTLQGTPQFLVVVSGKASDDVVAHAASQLESDGITVVGMGVNVSQQDLERFASTGYTYISPRATILKGLFLEEVLLTATKTDKDIVTDECKGADVADIVFIVDESGSIGNENFQLMRDFLGSIVSGLTISASRVRVGIVTYSDAPTAQAYLNTFHSKAEMLQFISILPYRGGGTQTGAALSFTHNEMFVEAKGSRKDIQKVVVVITDGESQDSVSEPAAALRRSGVTVYAVGIKEANETELVEMASHPRAKHVFNVESFTKLKPLMQNLQKILCTNIVHDAITTVTRKTDKEACSNKDQGDVYFLIDDSGSIQNEEFSEMRKFILELLRTFRIGPQYVRIGLVKYSDSPTLEFDLTTHSDLKSLEKAVNAIGHAGGGTETGKALSSMREHFKRAKRSSNDVQQYLIVITDGESTDPVKAPAEELRAQGVISYAIGVKRANTTQLQEIAGDSKRTFFVNNFDALKFIKNSIITEMCTEDACHDVPFDVIFLTDSSESIEPEDFELMKDFLNSVVGKSIIGQNEAHVGLMQYSTDYQLEFPLDKFYSKDEITKAIGAMQQMNQGTLTGKAIKAVSGYFDKGRGGRPELTRNLVVLTDGRAQDDVKGPAEALRAKGVVIYAIGVGKAQTSQLVDITGSKNRVFYQNDFSTIMELNRPLALKFCDKDCKKTEKADVIFLVDGSGSINADQYNSMKKFMRSVVNRTTVGVEQTQFGLILYSDDAESAFSLKECDSKQKILKAITDATQHEQNTYTGKALKYSLPFFSAEHGGRKAHKVPQILMVITDGEATDPGDLKASSDALRNNGVTVFSIGVGEAKPEELETMAGGDSSKVFYVDNFEALETLYKNISSVLCNHTKPVCRKDKIDLVFLLDQSSSINQAEHDLMKNFTADLVRNFNVSKDSVRIGLAQFNRYTEHGFYLKDYSTPEDVIGHIQKLGYEGGDTYLGNALDYMRRYFDSSQGSRRSVSIPQNLVLITDGDSHDDVDDAADRLRALGVVVFAIGVGDVHDLQLLQITGTPERLLSVSNYKSLASIEKQVVDTICKDESHQDPTGCTIDVAIGFDISQRTGALGEMLTSGHTKLQRFLPEIVRYISSVPGLCCAGPEPVQTKISFELVNRDGTSLNDVDFEVYDPKTVEKVMTWLLNQPTYFNTALLNYFKTKFEKDSNAGAKVLIIFSDGLDEDVMKLEHESELLRQSGVSALLVVALEGAHNPTQLQMVEFGRGFGYQLPLSISMPSVGSTILKQIDTAADRDCCNVRCKCSGHEGGHGSPGPPGIKGLPGWRGQQGFPGDEGVSGERGPPGPSGPAGFQGCPGARGQKGFRGVSGNRGADGEIGVDGINGEQGQTGADGARGARGDAGNPGIPGIRGETGLKGDQGLRGDAGEPGRDDNKPGAKGDPGNPGLAGSPGQDGKPGRKGDIGSPGPDGRRGPDGEKGARGESGAEGLPGPPGAPGQQGPRGANGEPGPKGIHGYNGVQGQPGPPGPPGTAGRRGSNGQKGQPGDPGLKGSQGLQGPRGFPGEDGRDGRGTPGPPGAKGDPGFPGHTGLLGEEGDKGTKGHSGGDGRQGRRGNSGNKGGPGVPGEPGHPGHRGSRGPPGGTDFTECELISRIRDNCACCTGQSSCPAYPTELVFALDVSTDVSRPVFERQRSLLLSLLEDMNVSETNCPSGARVAVVGYSGFTKHLIRFNDYQRKKELLEAVKSLDLEPTTHRRRLGSSMRFVAHNVFKRTRAGRLVRKVAVFFSNGPVLDSSDVVTAVMEYQALGINPAVISLRSNPNVSRALEADDTGKSIFVVLGRQQDSTADLRKVKNCAICYDPCRRSEECLFIQEVPSPQKVDVDLVLVADSSREMQADEYAGVQQLLGSVVEHLAVSQSPNRADNQARVAVVQSGIAVPKLAFDLQTHRNHEQMRSQIYKMQQQSGSSALGLTLDFTLREVFHKAANARRRKALMVVVGTQTSRADRAKLQRVSQKARCEGVALFVVTVGGGYSRTQVEELASLPLQQHLIHVDTLRSEEQGYAQRFFRGFLSALDKGVNTYPPPSLQRVCDQLQGQDGQIVIDGQGEAQLEVEDGFLQQTEGQSDVGQLDLLHTPTTGDQTFISGFTRDALCQLDADAGSQCTDFVRLWFFDKLLGACSPFWFGGCGGNANRFKTERECLAKCGSQNPDILPRPPLSSFTSKDSCLLVQDPGTCQNYTTMWFFDTEQNECSRFWYSGCGGNANRFRTQDDCENLCLTKSR